MSLKWLEESSLVSATHNERQFFRALGINYRQSSWKRFVFSKMIGSYLAYGIALGWQICEEVKERCEGSYECER